MDLFYLYLYGDIMNFCSFSFIPVIELSDYRLAEKQDTGMSNADSYSCIFVLFSLLEDHFFLIRYSVCFIISFFKEVKQFFFLSHPQKVLHYQCRMTGTLFSFLILTLLRNRIYGLLLSEGGSNVNLPVDFGKI